MDSGGDMESKAASGDEAMTSPQPELMAVAPSPGAGEEAAVSPPASASSTRPYYECVFCKRGFTTAQALGGHMNIHRRDRARPARDSPTGITSVSRNVDCYSKYHHLTSSSYSPAPSSTPISIGPGSGGGSSSFGMYYHSTGTTAAAAGMVDAERVSPSRASPRELSLFGAGTHDQDLQLGLGRHGRAGDASCMPELLEPQGGEPERELDLELRLGRRPRH
ncbi:hypothetical protein BS78_K179200 [Paspalum vaginatum]|uniref:C2H2-type domain-containing protein n=1 Tax=Paspalum vaginatum TaxID=158149 RepID=A0A9W7XDZ7_9POAL|nr:hypothetical protein BS78_K179200 [Paspalum vaginatum]